MTSNLTLIGGFAFNTHMFTILDPLAPQHIDINTLLSAPFSLDDLAQAIITRLDQKQKNTLIAYSTGGLVALKIALLRPDLIKEMIFINSTPKFIEEDAWRGIKPKDANRLMMKLTTLAKESFMQYFTSLAALPHKVSSRDYSTWWSDTCVKNLTALMQIIIHTDLRQALEQLSMPLHFINSTLDILVPFNRFTPIQLSLTDSTHLQLNQSELMLFLKNTLCS